MAIKSATRSTLENNIFYRSMLAGNESIILEDEYLLEEQVLSSSAASVTFSGLEQYAGVYQHLQIRMTVRASAGTSDTIYARFNSDTSTNYSWHRLAGDGSSVFSSAGANADAMRFGVSTGGSSASGAFAAGVVDILDPFETTKYPTIRSFNGQTDANYVWLWSGSWRNTAALSSILIYLGGNIVTGSRFSLYGAK